MHRRSMLRCSALASLGLLGAPCARAASPPRSIRFGIVPQQAARTLARRWSPLLAELSRRTGYRFRFATAPDIPAFERRVVAGEYDVAYMNPYHYVSFHASSGYRAVACESGKRLTGVLVVARDGDVSAIEQLNGRGLAFPAPAAFAAGLVVRAELARAGVAFTAHYVSSHDSVYRAVAEELYPAGGGILRTLKLAPPEVRDRLRVLWTSRGYTPHAIAVHPRLPADVAQRIAEAMYSLGTDAPGAAALAPLGFSSLAPARDADWDDVRALGLAPIVHGAGG